LYALVGTNKGLHIINALKNHADPPHLQQYNTQYIATLAKRRV